MRKLSVTENITLDGSIEMLGDWSTRRSRTRRVGGVRCQDAESDAMLLGRQTFEDFRSYWPNQSDDATGITAYLNGVTKYVVSTTMTDPEWENSRCSPEIRCRGTQAESRTRQGHRADRQHQSCAQPDRGRGGGRISVIRYPINRAVAGVCFPDGIPISELTVVEPPK